MKLTCPEDYYQDWSSCSCITVPLPSCMLEDFDGDNDLDLTDYNILQSAFGADGIPGCKILFGDSCCYTYWLSPSGALEYSPNDFDYQGVGQCARGVVSC